MDRVTGLPLDLRPDQDSLLFAFKTYLKIEKLYSQRQRVNHKAADQLVALSTRLQDIERRHCC
jgi:hypothetical protein